MKIRSHQGKGFPQFPQQGFQQQQTAQRNTGGLFGQAQPQQQAQQQQQPTAQGAFGGGHTWNNVATGFESVPYPETDYGAVDQVEEEEAFEKVGGPAAFLEPATVVSESPLAISYAVDGKSTIPSDGVAHQVSVAVLPFESKVTHVTIPRVQPNVYLQVSCLLLFPFAVLTVIC